MDEPAYYVMSDSESTGDEKSSVPAHEVAIGVDIGTSQCRVAVWNGTQVEVLENKRDQKLMGSYVTFKDDIPSGGVNNQLSHELEMLSGAAIFNMKRLIGRVDTDPVVHASKNLPFLVQTLDIGVGPFVAALVNNVWRSTTPEEVLAIYLMELKAMAETQLRRPVKNVVLSVPVSFSRFQINRVQRAFAVAGLHVRRLMPEPTAVALLYALQQQQAVHENMGSESDKVLLIFNMGAGYCDVAVSATSGGLSEIRALAGAAIGGEDILQNMMHHLLPTAENMFKSRSINDIKSMGLLRVATQDAIHKLSSQTSVHVDVDLGDGLKINKAVDRKEFEEVNRTVFEKCEHLVKECLHDAKVEQGGITDVILVGGCSKIPKVRNIVTSICNRDDIYESMDPLEAVVCGAALEGAVASGIKDLTSSLDLLTIQATPIAIGIRTAENNFVPIIPRNTTIPARRDSLFTTVHDNQTEALIVVYEGEGRKVEDNHLLGCFKIVGIPPVSKGVPEINVSMDINASNILRVLTGVVLPGSTQLVMPIMEVRMPTVDDGHGWCAEALQRTYGSNMDVVTLQKKI